MLIALEGIDGSGKTTLAADVADSLGITFVSRRSISSCSAFAQRQMSALAEILWNSGHSSDISASYWLALQAAWYCVLSEQVIAPAMRAGGTVLVDGWFYKFIAKLEVQGHDFDHLLSMFSASRKPDIVVLLHVAPSDALSRRPDMSPTEQGLHAGYETLNDASFLSYQKDVLERLTCYAGRFGWLQVPVHPSHSAEKTSAVIARLLAETIGRREAES